MSNEKIAIIEDAKTREHADRIKKELSYNDHGQAPELGDVICNPIFEEFGITPQILGNLKNARNLIVASSGLATGEKSNTELNNNKAIDRTVLSFDLAGDRVTHTYLRSRESNDPQTKGKTIVKKGALSTNHTARAGDSSRGLLKQVKRSLNVLAEEVLK